MSTEFRINPMKAKISDAEQLRVHTMLVIGGRDLGAGAVSVRPHGKGPQGAKPKAETVAEILAATNMRLPPRSGFVRSRFVLPTKQNHRQPFAVIKTR